MGELIGLKAIRLTSPVYSFTERNNDQRVTRCAHPMQFLAREKKKKFLRDDEIDGLSRIHELI